jgi:hypothetical protein
MRWIRKVKIQTMILSCFSFSALLLLFFLTALAFDDRSLDSMCFFSMPYARCERGEIDSRKVVFFRVSGKSSPNTPSDAERRRRNQTPECWGCWTVRQSPLVPNPGRSLNAPLKQR